MSKLTKGQQFFSDRSLEFAQEIYNQNESKINDILKDQKSNRDEILTQIAKILLSYNIANNVLSLNAAEKAKLYSQLSDLITEKIKSELKNETEATKGILTDVANDKYDTNNYIYSLGKDFNITQLDDKQLDEVVNKKLKSELWSDRIYANKNAIAKDLKLQVKKFLKGDINVNDIENVIKTKYNVNATNASRLVNTEITRVQSDANEIWAQEHDIKYQMFMATLDIRTSQICREHDGKVYAVDDPDKPIPPLHPNCRSVLVNLPDKDWRPKMRLDNETKQNIDWQSYQEWHKNYVENNPERLANEKMIKNKSSDNKLYEKYKNILGKEMPKTLADFQKLKYNNSNEWDLLKDYVKSRSNNMISAFNSFDDYKKYKNLIENKIVGLTTSNGIKITGQSKHFIERALGTTEDPHTGRPRSGVEINHIKDAIQNGSIRTRKNDPDSIKFITEKCIVSINPNTGLLIQVNPQ